MPGDLIFMIGGILPFIWITWLGVRYGVRATVTRMEPETLFVVESTEAREDRTGREVPVRTSVGGEDPMSLPPSRYASDRRRDDGEGTPS
jgi:nitric oxide reductase subunit B